MPAPSASLPLLLLALVTAACAPEPRSTPCSNDGQCRDLGGDYRYCLESRCVQCVGSASCGADSLCNDGQCVPSGKRSAGPPDAPHG